MTLSQLLDSTERDTWLEDFPGVALDGAVWTTLDAPAGTATLAVAGSQLTIGAGTDINEIVSIRSIRTFKLPFRVQFVISLSQRIANNAFYLEVVNAAGDTYASWLFDGTTATNAKITNASAGQNVTTNPSAALTVATTASQALFEIDLRSDGVEWSDRVVDSNAAASVRALRSRNIPKPDEDYYIRIRSVNGGVAPASGTSLVVERVMVQSNTKFVAEVSAGRGNNAGNRAIPVSHPLGGTFSMNPVTPSTTMGAGSLGKVMAAATTNATNLKASAGRILGWALTNVTAATKYVRIYNKASAPTVGTDVPVFTIAIPPNSSVQHAPPYPLAFATGISYAITNAVADLDATAVAVGDVQGLIEYV
jgi:hypothetical protein